MDRVSDEPLPALDAAGFLGFRHLERSDLAVTLLLEHDGGAALWMTQCDSIGLGGGTWVQRSANTAEMNRSVLTLLDDGRLLASPPLFPTVSPSVETWVQGAVCDVCLPGQPIAVVRCASPDAGAPACCVGGCGGTTPAFPQCTFPSGLRAGTAAPQDAVAAGDCVCPAGSVSAAECVSYGSVFCGG